MASSSSSRPSGWESWVDRARACQAGLTRTRINLTIHARPLTEGGARDLRSRHPIGEQPLDFVVREGYRFEQDADGPVFVYRMDKQKVSTLAAVERISKEFSVKRRNLSVCGLKDKQGRTEQLLGVLGGLGPVAGELGPGGVEGPAAVAGPLHRGDGAVDVGEGAVDLLGELVPVVAALGHGPAVPPWADGEAEHRLLLRLLAPARLRAVRHGWDATG